MGTRGLTPRWLVLGMVVLGLLLGARAATVGAAGGSLELYSAMVDRAALEQLIAGGFDVAVVGPAGDGQLEVELFLTPFERTRLASLAPEVDVTLWRTPEGLTFNQKVLREQQAGFQVYRSWDDPGGIRDELDQLAADHPQIVKRVVIGTSVQGREIVALRVTKDAGTLPDGTRPAVLYSSLQHAREWIAIEVNRRLLHHFVDDYGQDDEVTRLVDTTELWFVVVANPDGYQQTFTPDFRGWRKNLSDNDGDGVITGADGVDINRNFDAHWGYDNDGSSPLPSSETYRGPAAGSEPETRAMQQLLERVPFNFQVNYHSAAELILYPIGWQDQTLSADHPIFAALAGTAANPAIEGFLPIPSASLYITNGETCEFAYARGTLCFTPELSTAPRGSGGTQFEFPDDEESIQAEYLKNLPFAMDVAHSTANPSRPQSHLGNTVGPIHVDSFHVSFGDPQPVQANVARYLGDVTMLYRINDGVERAVLASEWDGGERFGDTDDVFYHRVRGVVTGAQAGDEVTVRFEAGGQQSEPFSYSVADTSGARVLVVAAEDYTGISPEYLDTAGPTYLRDYLDALARAEIVADVYDVDAEGRRAPDPLGVLGHYDAVIWYTGDDIITREPGMVPGTVSRLALDMMLAMRAYLNEGGKVLYIGPYAGYQFWGGYEYDPVANAACDPGNRDDDCESLNNDFMQYYLGADSYEDNIGTARSGGLFPVQGLAEPFGDLRLEFAAPAEGTQIHSGAFTPTSLRMPAAEFPQFASERVAVFDRPGDKPRTGDHALYSGESSFTYQRLMRVVDLTAADAGNLTFWIARQTRAPWDVTFVEIHTTGEDDWTTLPDQNGHTLPETGLNCWSSAWFDRFPHLTHYMTPGDNRTCRPVGTSGTWNAATGHSYGDWEEWSIDLTPYAGKEVELSISYVSSVLAYFGVLIDDVSLSTGETTSFEADLGGWIVAGAPAGHDPNPVDFQRATVGELPLPATGAIIVAADSILVGFGIERITDPDARAGFLQRALDYLLPAEPTPTPTPGGRPNVIYLPLVSK